MEILSTRPDRSSSVGVPFLWDRQVRPAIDALVTHPGSAPRALLVGNAGSGKSTALRHIQDLLVELECDVHVVRSDTASIAHIPRSEVLLVDDLHLLDDALIAPLRARAADPEAALIVANRPWPSSQSSRSIVRMLEQTVPAIVLGHVGRSDVLQHLDGHGRTLPEQCLQHILDVAGGVSWLVSAALTQHDERDCAEDDTHAELQRALEERISHRLDTIEPGLRRVIEELCIAPAGHVPSLSVSAADDAVLHGHAEGLLLRNGQPVPLVRATVRATVSMQRLTELSGTLADVLARSTDDEDAVQEWAGVLQNETIGAALIQHGDRMLDTNPARASELYRGALESGADAAALTARRAQAAWASGDLDAAAAMADGATGSGRSADDDRLVDISAGVWAARAMMAQADARYRALTPHGAQSAALAEVAAIAVGSAGAGAVLAQPVAPSTLSVSMELLRRGLSTSITADCTESVLADLVRASELYTSSRASGAVPELPAVIATVVALNLGGMLTAQAVIDDAIRGRHGGVWARPRLLLWRAWVAVQRARPSEARNALAKAHELAPTMSARDALLARAVQVAIARRYEDASGLEAAWQHARGTILRADIDLYLLHPLAELISSATRVGDTAQVQPHLERALAITAELGDPPLWIAHLRWAGIQQGILLGRPAHVAPHAKALVLASGDNHVAAVMASAGRVWTSVLGGTVDPTAVEAAAEGLASIGLKWDGARLAGHGAGRANDRKIAARLLACARELHPTDGTRKLVAAGADSAAHSTPTAPEAILSDREIEVARLVLQGKTYAEIGAAIFISPRTAEHHIAHIRQRLAATSRSDVIAKLRLLIGDDQALVAVVADRAIATEAPSLPHRVSG